MPDKKVRQCYMPNKCRQNPALVAQWDFEQQIQVAALNEDIQGVPKRCPPQEDQHKKNKNKNKNKINVDRISQSLMGLKDPLN